MDWAEETGEAFVGGDFNKERVDLTRTGFLIGCWRALVFRVDVDGMGLRSALLGVGDFARGAEAEDVYFGDFQDLLRSGGMSKVYCNKMRLGCDA